MNGREITRILHSRTGCDSVIVMALAAIVTAWFAGAPSLPGDVIAGGWPGLLMGLAVITLTAVVLQLVNKQFNLVRYDTALAPAMFMTMVMSLPALGCSFGAGGVVGLAMVSRSVSGL